MVIIVVKLVVSSRLNVYILLFMGVKIEQTVGAQNRDFFSKCISDGHVYRSIGHNQIKPAKMYALVRRNLTIYTEN